MIGVIGCGNMSSAIIRGISQAYPDTKFLTYTPSFTRAESLAKEIKGTAVKDLKDLNSADIIIIACKPQQFDSLVQNLKRSFDVKNKYFISIMAAVSIQTIQNKLGTKNVTRVMPNTPSLYSEGVSLILHSQEVSKTNQELCLKYFSACSKVHIQDSEELFDKVTTVSGSGPAYVFYFAQTFCEKLEAWGVEPLEARKIVTQLFKGSTKLMEEKLDTPLKDLINQVTSKGGVTIEAVKVYQANKLDHITSQATDAAFERSIELTNELK